MALRVAEIVLVLCLSLGTFETPSLALDEKPNPTQAAPPSSESIITPPVAPPGTPAQPSSEASNRTHSKKSRGRVAREKEAEGTEAPNRFNNTDIIIKSKYELNGQSLEVDTD